MVNEITGSNTRVEDEICLAAMSTLRKTLQVARDQSWQHLENSFDTFANRFLALAPANAPSTWRKASSVGQYDLSSHILSLHNSLFKDIDASSVIEIISHHRDVDITGFIAWFRKDIFSKLCRERNSVGDNYSTQIVDVCKAMYKLVLSIESVDSNLFGAFKVSELLVDVASTVPTSCQDVGRIFKESMRLRDSKKMQYACWIQLGVKISHVEVSQTDLQVVLSHVLQTMTEEELASSGCTLIPSFLKDFGGDVDKLLSDWIMQTLDSRVIVGVEDLSEYDDGEEDSLGRDDHVKLSRLMIVVDMISHPEYKIKAVLSLLQLSSIQSGSISNKLSLLIENLYHLCGDLTSGVSIKSKDALIEAWRLQHLRALSKSYRIKNIDSRDPRQVRFAVGLIAAKIHSPNSIKDALYFASSYSSVRIDIPGVLVKTIVHRILYKDNDGQYCFTEKLLADAFSDIPQKHLILVIESVIDCLMTEINVIPNIRYVSMKNITEPSLQATYMRLISCAILFSSLFLDNAKYSMKSAGSTSSQSNSSSFWISKSSRQTHTSALITPELMVKLKALKILANEFNTYLSLSDLFYEEICTAIAVEYAEHRGIEILENYKKAGSKVAGGESNTAIITATLRKFCSLLKVSPVMVSHRIIRFVLSKGAMVR